MSMQHNLEPLFPAKHDFAQTNIQLLNQLAETCTAEEMDLVTAAYTLACDLFGARFRGSGKPFLAHLVGTASIVAAQGGRVDLVAAALLHAAYVDGQFGQAIGGSQEAHRRRVRQVVGERIETLVFGYSTFAWRRSGAILRLSERVHFLHAHEKDLLQLRLANELEEYLDLGVMHYDNFEELALFGDIYGETVVELARGIGCDELASLLDKSFDCVRRAQGVEAVSQTPPEPRPPSAQATVSARSAGNRFDLEQSLAWNFRQQVQNSPDKTAVRQGEHHLTFRALDQQSDQLAAALVALCGPGNIPILSLFGHAADSLIAALGAWKANKIWVPLDAMHPETRLRKIVEDSGASLLLHDATLTELAASIVPDQRNRLALAELPVEQRPVIDVVPIDADSPACLIYTSGSTGTPKGVVHSHRTLLHLARRGSNALKISEDDRLTLLPSITQIAGVTDVLRSILNGATLLPFDVRSHSMAELRDWLRAERPTIYHSSATLLRMLSEHLSEQDRFDSVRWVHLGGEAVTRQDVATFKAHFPDNSRLVNNLGCTELSGYRQFFIDRQFQPESDYLPAGYPVEDIDVTVRDNFGRPVAPGDIGEIVVKSAYLALGYWQRPEETAAVFETIDHSQNLRSYRTGDQGYLQADGCLVFSGRVDHQVQIRGHRVDLAEIEAVLGEHPEVQRVAVTAGRTREQPLLAHVQPAIGCAPSARDLRRFVRDRLPAYMIPDVALFDALPLTVNDKIDYQRLESLRQDPSPVPPASGPDALSGCPVTETESVLARLWEHYLKVEQVQPGDNFFELGGDSLLVIRLVSHLESELGVKVTLREVFGTDTLSELATLVFARRIEGLVADRGDPARIAIESLLAQIEDLSAAQALNELAALSGPPVLAAGGSDVDLGVDRRV